MKTSDGILSFSSVGARNSPNSSYKRDKTKAEESESVLAKTGDIRMEPATFMGL